jgi:hypothetical protein
MRKLLLVAFFIVCAAPFTNAQDEINKYDFFVGYSHNLVDFDDSTEGFNGVNASANGNLSRYVGLKADYSFHRKTISDGPLSADADLHQLFGGVQLKDNSKATKFKPFAHAMAGFANFGVDVGAFDESESGFAAILGGGLDVKVSDRIDIRAIQVDYNPTRFDGVYQHNFRIGVGIVFR